jgi:hypothetical protein
MLTATKSLQAVKESAEKIRNNQPQRFPEAASPGDTWRQGDVYLELLSSVPSGAVIAKKPNPQLAPGTTQGSRHVLDSLRGVTVFLLPNADALTGPVLEVLEERTVTHPEHGHVVLPPGVYGVTYQRAFAEELRRQAD